MLLFFGKNMIICMCADVNEKQIRESIKSGNVCIDSLMEDLDVCSGCCSCLFEVKKIIHDQCQKDQKSK